MTLSCGCHSDFDPSDVDQWWEYTDDNFRVAQRGRRSRCKSCGRLIDPGEEVFVFERYRWAKGGVEEKIHGDNPISLASWFHCFECAGLFLSLAAYGYCVEPEDNMNAALREHWKETGFDPEKYKERSGE